MVACASRLRTNLSWRVAACGAVMDAGCAATFNNLIPLSGLGWLGAKPNAHRANPATPPPPLLHRAPQQLIVTYVGGGGHCLV